MAPAKTDPLDERRVDPRDRVSPPTRFAPPWGTTKMPEPKELVPGLRKSKVYWTYGSPPKGAPRSDVDDPPSSGWSTVLLVEEQGPKLLLFCPYSFQSYRVGRDSYEASSMQQCSLNTDLGADNGQRYFREMLPRKWAEIARHGQGRPDWALAERVLSMLGVAPPTAEQIERAVAYAPPAKAKTSAAAKPAGKPAGTFKPVKRTGRKGEILAAILAGKTSANVLTTEFEITRSNLLSQLFLLRKDHGIGYTAQGDVIALQMPEGVEDPFDA